MTLDDPMLGAREYEMTYEIAHYTAKNLTDLNKYLRGCNIPAEDIVSIDINTTKPYTLELLYKRTTLEEVEDE